MVSLGPYNPSTPGPGGPAHPCCGGHPEHADTCRTFLHGTRRGVLLGCTCRDCREIAATRPPPPHPETDPIAALTDADRTWLTAHGWQPEPEETERW